MKNRIEQKAFIFASEFLLPESALIKEISLWLITINKENVNEASKEELAEILYLLTVKYAVPLKFLITRFKQKKYITDASSYINNDYLIKYTYMESEYRYTTKAKELFGKGNSNIDEIMYKSISEVYKQGIETKEKVKEDIQNLGLNKKNHKFHDIYK